MSARAIFRADGPVWAGSPVVGGFPRITFTWCLMIADIAPQPQVSIKGHAVLSALIAATSGGVLWLWAANAAGQLEAWDGPLYFSRAVPALAIVAGLCGFLAPRHPWRWPATIYATQFVIMIARAEPPIGP